MDHAGSQPQQFVASHAVTGRAHRRADCLLGEHGPRKVVAGCTPKGTPAGGRRDDGHMEWIERCPVPQFRMFMNHPGHGPPLALS